MNTKAKLAPVVAVLNMKGGVGKTTISAHLMRVLYLRLMKKTVVIDFDPQFNLTQTVIPQTHYEKLKQAGTTILSVMEQAPQTSLFSVSQVTSAPPSLNDVSIVMKQTNNAAAELRIVPGDFGLVKYSLIDDTASLAPVRKRFRTFIEQSRQQMDLVCIDCNPSSSFMTICALEAATHVLVPVRPDRFSILGLELLDQFIKELPTLPTKPKIIAILNGISRTNYDPTVENILRSHPEFGSKTLSNRIYMSSILAANPTYTGYATDKKVPHRHSISNNLAAAAIELGKELGLT